MISAVIGLPARCVRSDSCDQYSAVAGDRRRPATAVEGSRLSFMKWRVSACMSHDSSRPSPPTSWNSTRLGPSRSSRSKPSDTDVEVTAMSGIARPMSS